ncbi:PREDICTED: T-cell surface glycoprotein CD5 [Condylura cristata]|uniref:T-cell surface glycoprotein CD5 n=1 Tax=Condylura cristata TaxID=143302 RepID=UPI0003345C9F|nr:PREDICTED: T-cell surface glycoprotein CD5 [Condylura cristata]
MGSRRTPLATLYLLGLLATSCLAENAWENGDLQVELHGSKCQGQLRVHLNGTWHTVSSRSWDMDTCQCQHLCVDGASALCSRLRPHNQIICHGKVGIFSNCSQENSHQEPLNLICLEPKKMPPSPTRTPATTTQKPTVSPRLQLVAGPWGLRCAGVVEFHSGGLAGAVSFESQDRTRDLGERICTAVHCGSFLKYLPEAEAMGGPHPGKNQPLSIQWKLESTSCPVLEQCFREAQSQEGGRALAVLCSDFQPKVQSRLLGGRSQCAGSVEVRQNKQWAALCTNTSVKGMARWEEVCQEHQCGKVVQVLATSETPRGLFCPQEKLSECHQLQENTNYCKRVFVTFHQKKQRQWIGPTEMNQNMSFHRNHTTTVRRSQADSPAVHVENEYSQPPRNSRASAYPETAREDWDPHLGLLGKAGKLSSLTNPAGGSNAPG